MTHLTKASESALMIGANVLLSEGAEFLYTLRDRMTKEEKQEYIRWTHAIKNWQKEFWKGDNC
jgi:hypothetical protein